MVVKILRDDLPLCGKFAPTLSSTWREDRLHSLHPVPQPRPCPGLGHCAQSFGEDRGLFVIGREVHISFSAEAHFC